MEELLDFLRRPIFSIEILIDLYCIMLQSIPRGFVID